MLRIHAVLLCTAASFLASAQMTVQQAVRDVRCETELLTLVDPHQTILRAHDGASAVYLRYRKLARGWMFSGAFTAFRHNHPQIHNVERFYGKPFLQISSQGYRGSDIDSQTEDWFDLTLPDFQPVFAYTIKGHERSLGFGIGRQFHSQVEVKSETAIVWNVKMDLVGPRDNKVAQLEYRAVYERTGRGPFRLRSVLLGEQRVANQDFESMLKMDPGPSEMALVRLSMGGLRKAARSRDPLLQNWVKSIVERCIAEGGGQQSAGPGTQQPASAEHHQALTVRLPCTHSQRACRSDRDSSPRTTRAVVSWRRTPSPASNGRKTGFGNASASRIQTLRPGRLAVRREFQTSSISRAQSTGADSQFA
jgi:hypothetical protein